MSLLATNFLTLLINYGADLNDKNKIGKTSLHLAVQAVGKDQSSEVVQFLIEKGADVHAHDSADRLPLHYVFFAIDK